MRSKGLKHSGFIALCVLILILAIALTQLIVETRNFKHQGIWVPVHHPQEIFKHIATPQQKDYKKMLASHPLKNWMTFNYINKIYDLPDNYLKELFAIASTKYPRLSVRTYARQAHVDEAQTLTLIEARIVKFHQTTSTFP